MLAELQQRCYGATTSAADGDGLAEAFKRGFAWRKSDKTDDDVLPPLYPFKL